VTGCTRQLSAADYRRLAKELDEFAARARLPDVRRDLVELARRFRQLAEFVEARYPHRR
jgi:hypothetical protein